MRKGKNSRRKLDKAVLQEITGGFGGTYENCLKSGFLLHCQVAEIIKGAMNYTE